MTQFQDATRCLLGYPKRAAGCVYQSLVHLLAFVSMLALGCAFLIAFVLFPITLPVMCWMIRKADDEQATRTEKLIRERDERLNCLSPTAPQSRNDKRGD